MENIENLDKFKKITELNDKEYRILESIRFRDEDQSVKTGSILAFTGLMIATSMVQLSASKNSNLFLAQDSAMLKLNIIGLLILFISSIIALFGLIVSKKYSDSAKIAVAEFDQLVIFRSKLVKLISLFTGIGATCILASFFIVLFN